MSGRHREGQGHVVLHKHVSSVCAIQVRLTGKPTSKGLSRLVDMPSNVGVEREALKAGGEVVMAFSEVR